MSFILRRIRALAFGLAGLATALVVIPTPALGIPAPAAEGNRQIQAAPIEEPIEETETLSARRTTPGSASVGERVECQWGRDWGHTLSRDSNGEPIPLTGHSVAGTDTTCTRPIFVIRHQADLVQDGGRKLFYDETVIGDSRQYVFEVWDCGGSSVCDGNYEIDFEFELILPGDWVWDPPPERCSNRTPNIMVCRYARSYHVLHNEFYPHPYD